MRSPNALIRLGNDGSPLWISLQVLREYLAAVTRPQATAPALPMASAIADVRRFRAAFQVAEERASVLDRLIQILTAHCTAGRQVHDANIVATMLDCGVRRLLTFNVTDFQRFAPLIESISCRERRRGRPLRGRPLMGGAGAIRRVRRILRGF
jgi:predicted nucleic acid-binding protein